MNMVFEMILYYFMIKLWLSYKAFNAVFRLERATEVLELTYLGKYLACVNANWYPGKHRSRQ